MWVKKALQWTKEQFIRHETAILVFIVSILYLEVLLSAITSNLPLLFRRNPSSLIVIFYLAGATYGLLRLSKRMLESKRVRVQKGAYLLMPLLSAILLHLYFFFAFPGNDFLPILEDTMSPYRTTYLFFLITRAAVLGIVLVFAVKQYGNLAGYGKKELESEKIMRTKSAYVVFLCLVWMYYHFFIEYRGPVGVQYINPLKRTLAWLLVLPFLVGAFALGGYGLHRILRTKKKSKAWWFICLIIFLIVILPLCGEDQIVRGIFDFAAWKIEDTGVIDSISRWILTSIGFM